MRCVIWASARVIELPATSAQYFGCLRSTFILYHKSSDDIVNEYNKCISPTKHLDALSRRLSLLFITPSVILKTLDVVTRHLNNIAWTVTRVTTKITRDLSNFDSTWFET